MQRLEHRLRVEKGLWLSIDIPCCFHIVVLPIRLEKGLQETRDTIFSVLTVPVFASFTMFHDPVDKSRQMYKALKGSIAVAKVLKIFKATRLCVAAGIGASVSFPDLVGCDDPAALGRAFVSRCHFYGENKFKME